MKILWIAQITKKNSYSKVSYDYIELIRNFTDWQLELYDISNDTPEILMLERIVGLQPDYVVILHNDGNLRDILDRLTKIRDKWSGCLVAFTPIDCYHPVPKTLRFKCDLILTMNSWAQRQITDTRPVEVLEHLVEDTYRVCDRRRLTVRRNLYGENNYRRFIVGMINANNCRKRLELGIEAFRQFHGQVGNSLLVIKTTPPEFGGPSNVYPDWTPFIRDLPVVIVDRHLSDRELNDMYNSFDIMINPTDGEGFGLTPFEAGLAGTLSVLPYHSAFLALLPGTRAPRYCVSSTQVPVEYARTTIDFPKFRSGDENMCFLAVKGDTDPNCQVDEVPPAIPIVEGVTRYQFSLVKTRHSDTAVYEDMDRLWSQVMRDINSTAASPWQFQVLVTSDIESLTAFLEWLKSRHRLLESTAKGLNCRITHTRVDSIELYIGPEAPTVGIVDPVEMSDKLLFYYRNREALDADTAEFQQHVKSRFNSRRILQQMREIFDKHRKTR